jgi:hypothetical protein
MQMFRKLRILVRMIADAVWNWREEVLRRDLNETFCCDGRECGCGAATVGEIYGEKTNPPAAGEGE